MLTKRIIPCLDVKDGETVKGIQFEHLVYAGDPATLAEKYAVDGADELVFLDITASIEARKTKEQWVLEVAKRVNIPFTVGGGINSVEDAYTMLHCGADKVGVNTAAVLRPKLISELAKQFGSQCVVVAIDVKYQNGKPIVHTHGGKKATTLVLWQWALQAFEQGAGEILLTSMDKDGTKSGYDIELYAMLNELIPIPIIASGGAGKKEDFAAVFLKGKADAALAAGLFHFNELSVPELKAYLTTQNIPIR
jgi:cyclase